MKNQKRFLFVLTSHDQLGETGEKTGFHFDEMAQPYYILQDHGFVVDIASIKGGEPPAAPMKEQPESVVRFRNDKEAMKKLKGSKKIDAVDIKHYEGIYLPGGHGAMWDFPESEELQKVVEEAWVRGEIVAAVCHGPAGLVNARDEEGEPIVKDRCVNCFTNAEEEEVKKEKIVPFLLESRLRELGGLFVSEQPFQGILVQEGTLIMGQNPKSSGLVANAILRALGVSPYNVEEQEPQRKGA